MRLIDADELLEVITNGIAPNTKEGGFKHPFDIIRAINDALTVEVNEWVSVKDRPPEEEGRYLCTYKFGNAYGVVTRKFINGGWYSSMQDYIRGAKEYDIIAWQPLPKPYEPQESEGNE